MKDENLRRELGLRESSIAKGYFHIEDIGTIYRIFNRISSLERYLGVIYEGKPDSRHIKKGSKK